MNEKLHILIVDDDRMMTKTLRDILRVKGHEAEVVYERQHLNAPSREGGDEKCLLPKAALFVVKWRHGYKERQPLCV